MSIFKKPTLAAVGTFLAGAVFGAGFFFVSDLGVFDSGTASLSSLEERQPQLETISGVVAYQTPEALLVETTGHRSLLVLQFEGGERFSDQVAGAYNRLHPALEEGQPLTVTGWRYPFGSRPMILVQSIH